MKEVKLPTSLQKIEENAFEVCTSLEKLIFTNNVRKIGDYCFYGCKALKTVELSDVKKISGFSELSDKDCISSAAFMECASLTRVEIPASIQVIGNSAFYNCTKLESVVMPKSIKKIDYNAFYCCDLRDFRIPDSVETIGGSTFTNCVGITELVIPDGVTKIGTSAFQNCENLSRIIVNNDIKREVGYNIFGGTAFIRPTICYAANVTFHLSEDDMEDIHKLLKMIKEADVQSTDSDLEKIRKVHDWLVINTSYSFKQYMAYSEKLGVVSTVLDKHFAICDAYSRVFEYTMDLLNIECIRIISEPMDHAWNMVMLDDGCWYHVDVTWDDPGSNDEVWEAGWLRYSNLLRDDAGIKETGHYGWQEDAPKADGTTYLNYFDINYIIKF